MTWKSNSHNYTLRDIMYKLCSMCVLSFRTISNFVSRCIDKRRAFYRWFLSELFIRDCDEKLVFCPRLNKKWHLYHAGWIRQWR